ncbi:MAG TPA: glycosyltransferase family 2 protein, partial [Thermoanaerobaculia bacterium]|nr:glycosyltransferase family 2 protein [Thermoanaerobaculia bacterium]
MTDLSAVVVTHRSAGEAIVAAESLRRAMAADAISGEVVLVDCGSDAEDRALLASVDADRRIAIENRGYAGGVNAGIAAARGRILLLCNADVEFAAGALAPLLDAASRPDVAAAAPVQHADPGGRVLLPTGFGAGFARDLAQALGARVRAAARFARHARRQWRLWHEGGDAEYLAGSVLALRREAVDRIGRFDERFPFEFEETEWEDRARAAGFRLVVVAAARARHMPGTSAARNPETRTRR